MSQFEAARVMAVYPCVSLALQLGLRGNGLSTNIACKRSLGVGPGVIGLCFSP